MIKRLVPIIICSALSLSPSFAEQKPVPGAQDPRVRSVTYQANNVVKVYGTYGISTMIIFAEDEQFETISVGDSESWEVVPAGAKNILFVKPIAKDAQTNMNVVTNKRIYYFDLVDRAPEDGQKIFGVRFNYPDQKLNDDLRKEAEERVKYPNISQIDKANVNIDYSFTGAKSIKPLKVFDDGNKTFFEFQKNSVPAIFVVNADYTETLVNFRREGEYVVVDGEYTQFTLRDGNEWVCLFNLRKPDFGAPALDIEAPKNIPVPILRPKSGNKKNG